MKTDTQNGASPRTASGAGRGSYSAFTLLELLTVIAIIGILAAIALPNLRGFSPNRMAAATRQLLDDVARARQLAISQRTTVFMVFVPASFWTDPNFGQGWTLDDFVAATNLYGKQLVGYNYIALRSLGDQPGRNTPRYLGPWRNLPEGTFISMQKFGPPGTLTAPVIRNPGSGEDFEVYTFKATNNFPFPLATTARGPQGGGYASLYYIGFNHLGQLVDADGRLTGARENIPLALGSVSLNRDPVTQRPTPRAPTVTESPAGNSTNAFNIVSIDFLTGRARVHRPEVQ